MEIEFDDDYTNQAYRILKFKNGETIICGIDIEDLEFTRKKFVLIFGPLSIVTSEDGGMYFRPWQRLANNTEYEIATDSILTSMYPKPHVEELYHQAMTQLHYQELREYLKLKSLSDEERQSIEEELKGDPFAEDSVYDPADEDQVPEAERTKYLH